jgi:uncharacterized repeat protein (TIGR03803 family)
MRSRRFSIRTVMAVIAAALLVTSALATAQTETVLHSFNNPRGANPSAGLVFDAAGNLYGTTVNGGRFNGGTVFELVHQDNHWTSAVLHAFSGSHLHDTPDGAAPYSTLIFDGAGNLYGTTSLAGSPANCGAVFELSPQAGSIWAESLIYTIPACAPGFGLLSSLTSDPAGNLYGTMTADCEPQDNCNAVFQLSPQAGGGWTEKSMCPDLCESFWNLLIAGVILDASGNLYGTGDLASEDGEYGGVWELHNQAVLPLVIFDLTRYNGARPRGSLVFDAAGNLYGTASKGGLPDCTLDTLGCGVVFDLSPGAHSTSPWSEKVLHNFTGNGGDGAFPYANLTFDAAGNLYGTTSGGGAYGYGTVFELGPNRIGGWKYRILHSFNNDGVDGITPTGGLILDDSGNLYGTTSGGGTYGDGTVFRIKP